MEAKKRNVSVRLSETDLEKVRVVAQRLGVREAELFRFSIKQTLLKLAPLHDGALRGVDLVPALLEWGEELTRHFELDSKKLAEIINGGVQDPREMVDAQDIRLMAILSLSGQRGLMRAADGIDQEMGQDSAGALKHYLLRKYLYRQFGEEGGEKGDTVAQGPVAATA